MWMWRTACRSMIRRTGGSFGRFIVWKVHLKGRFGRTVWRFIVWRVHCDEQMHGKRFEGFFVGSFVRFIATSIALSYREMYYHIAQARSRGSC
jgi:hypothetical protein